MTVCIIGCGIQGSAIAQKLLEHHHEVVVHDRLEAQMAHVRELGAQVELDPVKAIRAAGVILLVLPAGDAALRFVSDGAVQAVLGGRLIVQMGNMGQEETLELARLVEEQGGACCEAIIGGPIATVLDGTCPLYVGGQPAHIEQVEEMLTAFGECKVVGDLGSGAAFNLATLSYLYPLVHGFGLACAMIERSGLDMDGFLDYVAEGFLGHPGELLARFLYPAHFAHRSYPLIGPAQVKNDGARAETVLAHQHARRLGLAPTLLDAVRTAHQAAFNDDPEADWSSVYDQLAPPQVLDARSVAPPQAGSDGMEGKTPVGAALIELTVGDAMNPRVATITPDATLREAAELLVVTKASDLMVRETNGRFVGVLSEGDVIRAVLPDFDEMVWARGSLQEGGALFLRAAHAMRDQPIRRLIIRNALTLAPTDSLLKAAACMAEKMIRRLPVVDEGHLIGTLSRADLCWAIMLQRQVRRTTQEEERP